MVFLLKLNRKQFPDYIWNLDTCSGWKILKLPIIVAPEIFFLSNLQSGCQIWRYFTIVQPRPGLSDCIRDTDDVTPYIINNIWSNVFKDN